MRISPLLLRALFLLPVVMSLWAFCLMGADKRRAKQGARRVPERTLWLAALLGGAAGGTLGMWCFRHKTKHWYFKFGFPALALLQLGAAAWICSVGT